MKKPTILIVDDESQFIEKFAEFIKDEFNADVIVKSNSFEALEVIDNQKVDVLFQDIHMPGPSGFEVIKHIKKLNKDRDMIIFVISKWNDGVFTRQIEDLGVKYIPKPLSLKATHRVLTEEFENRGWLSIKGS